MLQWSPTWNRNNLGIPTDSCFLDLRVTQLWASNIGNCRNKNKHNISPVFIPLPPVSLTFFTASESINLSSSTIPHCLHFYHCNSLAASPLPQKNPSLPQFDTIAAAIFWPLLIKNLVFFSLKSYPFQQGTLGNAAGALDDMRKLQRMPSVPSKCLHLFALKFLIQFHSTQVPMVGNSTKDRPKIR